MNVLYFLPLIYLDKLWRIMDDTDSLGNKIKEESSQIKNNAPNKISARSPKNLTDDTFKGVGTIINPPPPPLPGVFIFDPPAHQSNISQVDSNFSQSIKTVDSSFSQGVSNYSESVPVSYNRSKYSATNMNDISASTDLFQCSNINLYDYSLPHEEKGIRSLQPVVPSSVDEVLPSVGSVYQSLQPVAYNAFEVPSQSTSKVYQPLNAHGENEFRLNEEHSGGKFYQQLQPLDVESRFQQDEEPKIYQQLKPVIPTGESTPFHHLKPVPPTFDAPQYANSKLYQQLSQPPNRGGSKTEYHSDSKLYHQLRPVAVSDYELRHSHPDQNPKHTFTNSPVKPTNSVNPYSPIRTFQPIPKNSYYQELKNVPGVFHSSQSSRTSSFNMKDNTEHNMQGSFPLNKPKVYLELRNPTLRQQIETTESYQTGVIEGNSYYCNASPKYNSHHSPNQNSQYPLKTHPRTYEKRPNNIHTSDIHLNPFKLPSPHEFNLPNSNYNTSQNILKAEKIHTNINNSTLESKFISSTAKTFTDGHQKSNNTFGKLSLPKNPVCYGDFNAKREISYHPVTSLENEQSLFIKNGRGTESSSSSPSENQSLVRTEMNNTRPPLESSLEELKHMSNNEVTSTVTSIKTSSDLRSSVSNSISKRLLGNKQLTTQSALSKNKNVALITEGAKCIDSTGGKHLQNYRENDMIPTTSNIPSYNIESLKSDSYLKTPKCFLLELSENKNENSTTNHMVNVEAITKSLQFSRETISNNFKSLQPNRKRLHSTKRNPTERLQESYIGTTFSNTEQSCKRQKFLENIVDVHEPDDKFLPHQTKQDFELIHDHTIKEPSKEYGANDLHFVKHDNKVTNKPHTNFNNKFSERKASFIVKNDNEKVIVKDYPNLVAKKFRKNKSQLNDPISLHSSTEGGVINVNNDCPSQNNHVTGELSVSKNVERLNLVGIYSQKNHLKSCNAKFEKSIQIKNSGPGQPIKRKRGRPRKIIVLQSIDLDKDICNLKPDIKPDKDVKRKRGRPRKIIQGIASDKIISTVNITNTEHYYPIKKKRGRPRKIFKQENTITVEGNSVHGSLCLENTGDVRRKRKYTKRFIKDSFAETNSIIEKRSKRKYIKRKRFPVELGLDDEESRSFANLQSEPELKEILLDPLEGGLISDDEGEVVFLGFDMADDDDENDTILGFDLSQNGEEQDQFSLIFGQLANDSMTVECDPRSLLDAPPNTTSCPQCQKTFLSHHELVDHMQLHAEAMKSSTNKQPFKCTDCFLGFSTSEKLERHVKFHHEVDKKYSCPICSKCFTTRHYVNRHFSNTHRNNQDKTSKITFFCPECPLTFISEKLLKTHESKIHKKILHQCHKCLKHFVKQSTFERHMKFHDDGEIYPCAYCNQEFTTKGLLRSHWLMHSDHRQFLCKICDGTFTSAAALKRHRVVHSREKLFRCEICQRSFSLLNTLKTHLLIHTGARRFECKFCHKKFNRRDVLNAHQSVHTGEKKFQCDICFQKFRWRHAVRSHKLIYHTTEKPYACEICNKTFSHPNSFKKHAQVHAEKTFLCQICLKAFSRPSTLKAHILVHTDLKPFICDICNRGFRSKSHLRNHFLVHTKEKPWICKFCNKGYKDRNQLLKHKRLVHCKLFYNKVLPHLPGNMKTIQNLDLKSEPLDILLNKKEGDVMPFPDDTNSKTMQDLVSYPTNNHFLGDTNENAVELSPSLF